MINNNAEVIEMTDGFGNPKTVVKVQTGEDSFTWMDKSDYDAMQAEQSTPNLPA